MTDQVTIWNTAEEGYAPPTQPTGDFVERNACLLDRAYSYPIQRTLDTPLGPDRSTKIVPPVLWATTVQVPLESNVTDPASAPSKRLAFPAGEAPP